METKSKFHCHSLFPTFVWRARLPIPSWTNFKKELLSEILQIQKTDVDGQRWSAKNYPAGYTSYGSMDQLQLFSSSFAILEKKIRKEVSAFAKHLEFQPNSNELQMSTCWVNVMPPGAQHSMHLHPLSAISGSFYVSLPKGSSQIRFEDPRLPSFMASPPRKAQSKPENQRFVSLSPQEGEVLLFESWTKHEVPLQKGPGARVSVSFNYDWTQMHRRKA